MNDETTKKGMMIIDMGSHRKKAVKSLRRGGGKLVRDIEKTVDELRASGAVDGKSQVLVAVVKEKETSGRGVSVFPLPFIRLG